MGFSHLVSLDVICFGMVFLESSSHLRFSFLTVSYSTIKTAKERTVKGHSLSPELKQVLLAQIHLSYQRALVVTWQKRIATEDKADCCPYNWIPFSILLHVFPFPIPLAPAKALPIRPMEENQSNCSEAPQVFLHWCGPVQWRYWGDASLSQTHIHVKVTMRSILYPFQCRWAGSV